MSKHLKKIILIGIAVIVIAGAAYIFGAVAQTINSCPTLKTGDIVQVEKDAVSYVLNPDLKLIPASLSTIKSWDSSPNIIAISGRCFANLSPTRKYAVNLPPGSAVIKYRYSDQLYAILPNNKLAKITTPEVVKTLYGDKNGKYSTTNLSYYDWAQFEERAADLTIAKPHPGMLINVDGLTYYVYMDGKLREVTSQGFTANKFQTRFVRKIDKNLIKGLQYGSKIDSAIPALLDKTQATAYPTDTDAPTLPPTTPTLTGEGKTNGAYLNWTKYDGQNFRYYLIVRSETNSNPAYPSVSALFTSNNQSLTTYTDTRAARGKTYYYNLCVQTTVNSYLCGNALKVTMPAPSPTPAPAPTPTPTPSPTAPTLTATGKTDGVYLTWTKYTGTNLEYYKVVRSATNPNLKYPDDGYLTYSTNANFTSYTDKTAKANTSYYYRICVKKTSGTIICSNVVSAKIIVVTPVPVPTPTPTTTPTPTPTSTPTTTPTPTPTYSLSTSASSVNEGASITLTLSTTNVANDTNVAYTITGINSSDLSSGALTGNFKISSNKATLTFTLANDTITEGAETMKLSLNNGKASINVTVNDTSLTPAPTPTPTPTPTTTPSPYGTTYYIRTDGGDATQCTGLANAAYSGSGSSQACAWKHPFLALPPGGTAKIKGSDTLIIANGSYKMGYGAPGATNCDSAGSYDCMMAKIPSGLSASQPTRVLGAGYSSGCSTKPELYGSGRPWAIIDMNGSSNVEMQCLEITDHSSCVEHHASSSLRCNRDNPPYGDWASIGLRAADSKNVTLKNLDIHGLADRGVLAGRLTDWTIENTKITANGWAGWDGDIDGSDSISGTITFKKVNIDWNGCAETYPGKQPTGCWGQSAGGYGDGLGTGDTGGNWVFEDSTFLHNTSDGLDLLYHRSGGKITIRRVRAEGNAGNQIKTAGEAEVTDSVIIGNCGYFSGKSFTYNVDHCRALGSAILADLRTASQVSLYNNSVYSEGDCLINADRSGSGKVKALNNIFYAGTDYHQTFEKSCYFYTDTGVTFDNDYNITYLTKDGSNYCAAGSHNLCNKDPLFTSVSASSFDLTLRTGSPAIDSGTNTTGITTLDFLGLSRPYGSGVDRGAYERR